MQGPSTSIADASASDWSDLETSAGSASSSNQNSGASTVRLVDLDVPRAQGEGSGDTELPTRMLSSRSPRHQHLHDAGQNVRSGRYAHPHAASPSAGENSQVTASRASTLTAPLPLSTHHGSVGSGFLSLSLSFSLTPPHGQRTFAPVPSLPLESHVSDEREHRRSKYTGVRPSLHMQHAQRPCFCTASCMVPRTTLARPLLLGSLDRHMRGLYSCKGGVEHSPS